MCRFISSVIANHQERFVSLLTSPICKLAAVAGCFTPNAPFGFEIQGTTKAERDESRAKIEKEMTCSVEKSREAAKMFMKEATEMRSRPRNCPRAEPWHQGWLDDFLSKFGSLLQSFIDGSPMDLLLERRLRELVDGLHLSSQPIESIHGVAKGQSQPTMSVERLSSRTTLILNFNQLTKAEMLPDGLPEELASFESYFLNWRKHVLVSKSENRTHAHFETQKLRDTSHRCELQIYHLINLKESLERHDERYGFDSDETKKYTHPNNSYFCALRNMLKTNTEFECGGRRFVLATKGANGVPYVWVQEVITSEHGVSYKVPCRLYFEILLSGFDLEKSTIVYDTCDFEKRSVFGLERVQPEKAKNIKQKRGSDIRLRKDLFIVRKSSKYLPIRQHILDWRADERAAAKMSKDKNISYYHFLELQWILEHQYRFDCKSHDCDVLHKLIEKSAEKKKKENEAWNEEYVWYVEVDDSRSDIEENTNFDFKKVPRSSVENVLESNLDTSMEDTSFDLASDTDSTKDDNEKKKNDENQEKYMKWVERCAHPIRQNKLEMATNVRAFASLTTDLSIHDVSEKKMQIKRIKFTRNKETYTFKVNDPVEIWCPYSNGFVKGLIKSFFKCSHVCGPIKVPENGCAYCVCFIKLWDYDKASKNVGKDKEGNQTTYNLPTYLNKKKNELELGVDLVYDGAADIGAKYKHIESWPVEWLHRKLRVFKDKESFDAEPIDKKQDGLSYILRLGFDSRSNVNKVPKEWQKRVNYYNVKTTRNESDQTKDDNMKTTHNDTADNDEKSNDESQSKANVVINSNDESQLNNDESQSNEATANVVINSNDESLDECQSKHIRPNKRRKAVTKVRLL